MNPYQEGLIDVIGVVDAWLERHGDDIPEYALEDLRNKLHVVMAKWAERVGK